MKKSLLTSLTTAAITLALTLTGCASTSTQTAAAAPEGSFLVADLGHFTAGGTVKTSEGTFDPNQPWTAQQGGQTIHGDHASVNYVIPANAKALSMVFLHGYGQSSVGWSTTPDGRDGFQQIFLKRGYSTYLVDQPGRGQASQTTTGTTITAAPSDQTWYTQFRIGLWPDRYPNSQFPAGDEALDNFFRWMVPDTGMESQDTIVADMAAVLDKSGPAILLTHSAGGLPGFMTAIASDNVKAIVAFEPGGEPMPASAIPAPTADQIAAMRQSNPDTYGAMTDEQVAAAITSFRGGISDEDFAKLCKIPIIFYYGDNIPDQATGIPSQDFWMQSLASARQWADLVNSKGGDATVVHLPEVGITGNDHFIFADMNNAQVADNLSQWLHDKGLDK